MENRELGLQVIHDRIIAAASTLNLKKFDRAPTTPVTVEELPCVFMTEGLDQIIKHSSRTYLGYPAMRMLEVVIELIISNADRDADIHILYRQLRSVVLSSPKLVTGVVVRELRCKGPSGYGLQDVLGMQLVIGMDYSDDGT